jgi:hypothetical protein
MAAFDARPTGTPLQIAQLPFTHISSTWWYSFIHVSDPDQVPRVRMHRLREKSGQVIFVQTSHLHIQGQQF